MVELAEAINKANKCKGPFLVHARVLKEDNVLPMVAPGASLSETIYYPANEVKDFAKKKLNLEDATKQLAYKV